MTLVAQLRAAVPCQPAAAHSRRPAAAAAAAVAPQWCQPPSFGKHKASRPSVAAAAASVPEPAAAELDLVGLEEWVACSNLLQERCGFDAEAAHAALLKGFGWKGQGYWRQERVNEAPTERQLAEALDFLASLGIADAAEVGALLRAYPEALALGVPLMQDNVAVLREKWSMKGSVVANAIKRKPRVLGINLDCEGTCAGLCTRCWAQF